MYWPPEDGALLKEGLGLPHTAHRAMVLHHKPLVGCMRLVTKLCGVPTDTVCVNPCTLVHLALWPLGSVRTQRHILSPCTETYDLSSSQQKGAPTSLFDLFLSRLSFLSMSRSLVRQCGGSTLPSPPVNAFFEHNLELLTLSKSP